MFKQLFTDIQGVYEGAKDNLSQSLNKFNRSLDDAVLLIGIG